MTRSDRDELLEDIQREQRVWRDIVAEVGRDRMNEPGPMGEWTFKDLVGHLAGWRGRTIARLEALANGRADPPTPWPPELKDDDSINAWIRVRDRKRSLDDVLTEYDRSFDRLAAVIRALPGEALVTPGYLPWRGDTRLLDVSFFGHLHEEHEQGIREWLSSRVKTR
jgi:hypothetical protein